MVLLNMTQKNFIFVCNDNVIEKQFEMLFVEETFKNELTAAFLVTAQHINTASRKRRLILFDDIYHIRSMPVSTSEEVIPFEQTQKIKIDVKVKNQHSILVSIENLEDAPKYNEWFRRSISYYYCIIKNFSKGERLTTEDES